MNRISNTLALGVCLLSSSLCFAAKPTIEKHRKNGAWELHCQVSIPEEGAKMERLIGELRTQCEIAALRLAVKEHSRSGSGYKAQLSKEKINQDEKLVSVVARLVAK